VYRDLTFGFTPNENNLFLTQTTTKFTEKLAEAPDAIYYKITSVDTQENESEPSDEVTIIVTGVEVEVELAAYYKLYPNYPNPFNPETTIGFRLKAEGYVRLNVYDIKGELIEKLVDEYKPTGYHEVKFNGTGKNKIDGLASGIYLYSIDVFNQIKIPVYRKMNKMIMTN